MTQVGQNSFKKLRISAIFCFFAPRHKTTIVCSGEERRGTSSGSSSSTEPASTDLPSPEAARLASKKDVYVCNVVYRYVGWRSRASSRSWDDELDEYSPHSMVETLQPKPKEGNFLFGERKQKEITWKEN